MAPDEGPPHPLEQSDETDNENISIVHKPHNHC